MYPNKKKKKSYWFILLQYLDKDIRCIRHPNTELRQAKGDSTAATAGKAAVMPFATHSCRPSPKIIFFFFSPHKFSS